MATHSDRRSAQRSGARRKATRDPAAAAAGEGEFLTELRHRLPVEPVSLDAANRRIGLVIVDEINGFATIGCGPLAPAGPNAQIDRMVGETDRLARLFQASGRPIAVFLDTHSTARPEPPYPPHCLEGSGHEDLVPALAWLAESPQTIFIRKDCINGFVGSIAADGSNRIVDWVNRHRLDSILVVGICTDICVMDFVLTMLSARNHELMPSLEEIAVHELACATYDLPRPIAESLGLPVTSAHPQALTHHLGLYFMASRGALLVDAVAI